jgi:radical SAM superfamily enzyme YgiQ (UPF0313 family)
MKVLFVYPGFARHADDHPELRQHVPMNEYLGSPSLGLAIMAGCTPPGWEVEYRDDRLEDGDAPTDADVVALSFFTAAASRALEIADSFRAQGVTVVAGGIFPTMMPDVVAEHVDAVVIGEGEPVWAQVLEDVASGRLAKRYGPHICSAEGIGVPDFSMYFGSERPGLFEPDDYPVQVSRGCPLSCRACALPGVMGKTMRPLPLDNVKAQLEQLISAGKRACLTEDTSWFPGSGRRRLDELLDWVIDSGQPAPFSYVGISVPQILVAPERLLRKARAAGVDMFYLVTGFDPATMQGFAGLSEKHLQRCYDAIARCHDMDIEPYTSFLLGGDQDDVGTVDRMLDFADRSGIRKAEFAIATPYPGTPQWWQLKEEDRILTTEWRRYNDANVVFQPAQMTPDEVTDGYLRLWKEFYASRGHLADLSIQERTIQF